jgi:hypothetical protein
MRHVVLLAIFGLFGTFQNCSQPLDSTGQDMITQAQQNMPFAYVAAADTISYMSCTRMPTSVDTSAYYSFRVGAYNAGAGLSLSDAFVLQTQGYSPVTRGQVLSQSMANSGATLQLSIRQLGNFQNVLSGSGSAVAPGLDTGPFLSELDTNPMASQLGGLVNEAFQNFFQGSFLNFTGGSGLMQSSLLFVESETASVSVRENLNNRKGILSLTFTESAAAGDTSARAPINASPAQVIYGTGYLLQFGAPPAYPGWPTSDQRVLSSVTEMDLGGGTLLHPHGWTCPVSLQFKIVQLSDVFPTSTGSNFVCNMQPDPQMASLSAADQQTMNAIRNVLPVASWYVDLTNHCVVPKASAALVSCYGDRTGLPYVDYTSGACMAFDQSTQAIGNCPHWVSVCIRQ